MVAVSVDRINGLQSSLAIKAPVAVATTGNLASLAGLLTVDSVALAEGSRVLVWQQTDPTTNGVWSASTGAWTRTLDFDGNTDVVSGTLILVTGGTTYAGKLFKTSGTNPIHPGDSAIAFAPYVDFFLLPAWAVAFLQAANAFAALTAAGAAMLAEANVFTQDQTLSAGKGLIFEGATDDTFEAILKATDPTADRTLWLPDKSGTLALLDAVQNFTSNQRANYDNTKTVSGGGSFTFDGATMAQQIVITATGAGTVTFAAPTNIVEGMMYKFIIKAGDTSARPAAFHVNYLFPSASSVLTALSQTVGGEDILPFIGRAGNKLALDGGRDVR